MQTPFQLHRLLADLPHGVRALYRDLGGGDKFLADIMGRGKQFVDEHGPEAYRTVLALAHVHANASSNTTAANTERGNSSGRGGDESNESLPLL